MKMALVVILLVVYPSQNAFAGWQKKVLAVALVAGGGAMIYAAKEEDETVRNALVSIGAGLAVAGITYLWKSGRNAHGMEKFDSQQKLLLSRLSRNITFPGSGDRLQLTRVAPTYKPTFGNPSGSLNGKFSLPVKLK